MNRQIKAIFIVSILFNLFMAGVIIGHTSRWFLDGKKHFMPEEIAQALPLDKRKLFDQSIKASEEESGNLHKQVGEAHKKALELLEADNFDKQAYLAQIQELNKLHDEMTEQMANNIATLAEKFSQPERVILAGIFRRQR